MTNKKRKFNQNAFVFGGVSLFLFVTIFVTRDYIWAIVGMVSAFAWGVALDK